MPTLRPRLIALLAFAVLTLPAAGQTKQISDLAAAEKDSLLQLYTYLHLHPELSFHENETAAKLVSELKPLGFEVTPNVGGHGFVAVLKNGPGPTVMVRTDLDALPVVENTGRPYASKIRTTDEYGNEVGVMHACGHDIHMTSLVGTARVLTKLKNQWSGTLVLIGQPAEERGAGAKAMLDDGLFKRFPRPDYALALHTDAALETGRIGYHAGYALANVDSVDITIRGVGGHGAYPHLTKDPIVIAAQVILALQTIVSREVRPIDSAVVTVGSIHGGAKHNVIPDEVKLQLTVRSYTDAVRQQILDAIQRHHRWNRPSRRSTRRSRTHREGLGRGIHAGHLQRSRAGLAPAAGLEADVRRRQSSRARRRNGRRRFLALRPRRAAHSHLHLPRRHHRCRAHGGGRQAGRSPAAVAAFRALLARPRHHHRDRRKAMTAAVLELMGKKN